MPKGGSRKGAGRKARPTPKSKPIWCGQISDEDRKLIVDNLSPDERYQVLMAAANKACSGRVDSSAQSELFSAGEVLPAKVTRQSTRRSRKPFYGILLKE